MATRVLILLMVLLALPARLRAADNYVTMAAGQGSFALVDSGGAATIVVDAGDWPGVQRAAKDLQSDVEHVSAQPPAMAATLDNVRGNVVIVGTIGKSRILDALARAGKIDVAPLQNKWESFIVQGVSDPAPGIASALVIAGSDKRGAIFGIYDLSEKIGVSPWSFWADVPPQHHDAIYVAAGVHQQGEPSVKYRGIFINDEAPDLSNWVREKYGTVPNLANVSNYNHEFYAHVFELLLRLKANYLWPAMWNNAFNEDDPENARLADEYGIVMGTSHQEPMLRAQKEWDRQHRQSWNYYTDADTLQAFWKEGVVRNKRFESILTIGLRGANDTPMIPNATRDQSMALLKDIITAQRKIIAENLNPDPAKVPQLWCPYKEVLDYYNAGFRVPDDVTILWTDDNWGNIRRLPTAEERSRPGGAGIYYHFDYVGGPRNYKWVNTNPLAKIWEQMEMAKAYGADRIWIVNVGHLKGLELPIDYFLRLGWNAGSLSNENIEAFTREWAAEQFGSEHAEEIASILTRYGQYQGRRKPELLEPLTYSLITGEADRVVADWNALATEAEKVYGQMDKEHRDAFYEIVLFPVKACANVNEMYVAAGRNGLYAQQGRVSANDLAQRVTALFENDAKLMDEYNHQLGGGKWDHFMDQLHIGYTTWQDPPRSVAPRTQTVTPLAGATLGVAIEGSTEVWPRADASKAARLPAVDVFNRQSRFIDVFNRGAGTITYKATASRPWVVIDKAEGTFEQEQRLMVTVDWEKVPVGGETGQIDIAQGGAVTSVQLDAIKPREIAPETLEGFVETDGVVSIEAEHATRATATAGARWAKIEGFGRTLSGMTPLPMTATSVAIGGEAPTLEYQVYFLDSGAMTLSAYLSPSLNVDPERGVRFAVSVDDKTPQVVTAVPADFNAQNGNRDWETTVKNGIRIVTSTLTIPAPGYHTVKVRMVDPGVVIEKLVGQFGEKNSTYLGPPESFHRAAK